jgi:hypothetical protein
MLNLNVLDEENLQAAQVQAADELCRAFGSLSIQA